MTTVAQRIDRRSLALLACIVALAPALAIAQGPAVNPYGPVEYETQSQFSRIRVRAYDRARTLMFVRDSGEEVVESMVDIRRPYNMLVEYTRSMFLSYVHRAKHERVAIVGLGGGAMIHFLRHYDPQVKVDVVEIDPAIIDIADRLFAVRSEGNVRVFQADGIKFLTETKDKYDVIYMDAFLKPSEDTDVNGVPKLMKTADFYARLKQCLTPDGLVVFNINPHDGVREDINLIARSFNQVYVYTIPVGGYVVVASTAATRDSLATLRGRARALDRSLRATFSFDRLTQALEQEK